MMHSANALPRAEKKRRILLAEDDTDLRELIAATLRGEGFDVTEAVNGDDLIEKLTSVSQAPSTAYDLILSDIRMPTFTALDVLVGAREVIGRTPVVLLTAFGDPETHRRALYRGATMVLDKPIRLSDLSATVKRVIDQAQNV